MIGGGPAGLTAAFALTRRGVHVTVLESRPWLGGRTRTDEVDGYRVDAAAQLFGSMYTRFRHVLRAAGGEGEVIRSPGRDAMIRGGRVHEVVYGSIPSMLVSGAVPIGTKIRLGATYLPFLHRHGPALQMHALERAAAAGLDGESIAAWGAREMGKDFVEYLVAPLLAAYYGVTPEETSAGLYHALAHSGMEVEVLAMHGGAGRLVELLAERVREGGGEVRTGTPVARLDVRDDGVRVELEAPLPPGGAGDPERSRTLAAGGEIAERFDGAVLAVPPGSARVLLGGASPAIEEWLAGVRQRPAVTVALLLDRPVGERYFGLAFPRGEAAVVSSLCVEESKGAGLVPPGRGLVVAFLSPPAAARLLDADATSIYDAVVADAARVWPWLAAHVTRAKVYRWKEGATVFHPGYLHHLGRARSGPGEGRLAIAGDFLHSPTVEGAVLSGERAAERLLERLRPG